MKAIILAAGRWTRLRPITDTIPKPLIKIRGKSILEHLLEQLCHDVDEFILVVNYKKEVFIDTLWNNYCGVPISYKKQWEEKWTGAAIKWIPCNDDVLIVYADSIFSHDDIYTLIHSESYGCLVQEVNNPEKYGIFSQDINWNAIKVIEKPQEDIGNLANLWAYKFSRKILTLAEKIKVSPRGEYELTDAINEFCKTNTFKLFPIKWYFLDISYPDDIEKVEKILQKQTQKLLQDKPHYGTATLIAPLRNYKIFYGIKDKHIPQLIEYSQDESDTAIQKNTSDKNRFQNIESIQEWYNKERHIFTLIHTDGSLGGIWWWRACGAPHISEYTSITGKNILKRYEANLHTNAIRIYKNLRGSRIATPFVNAASMYYRDIFPDAIMCIDTDESNIPLQKAYEKWWYLQIGYWENNKSTGLGKHKRLIYIEEWKKS